LGDGIGKVPSVSECIEMWEEERGVKKINFTKAKFNNA
jgi:hypothetical protein